VTTIPRSCITLNRLWHLARACAKQYNTIPEHIFGPIGLYLVHPDSFEVFYPTPQNATVFARTGGNGIHYSLLHINHVIDEISPVIMTIPFANNPNVVVGESLTDFLCIGCKVGYFGWDNLSYKAEERDPDGTSFRQVTVNDIETGNLAIDLGYGPEEDHLLQQLTKEFELGPKKDIDLHLQVLSERYLAMVRTAPP
jgi:hypothetical protein